VSLFIGRVVHAEVDPAFMDEGHLRPAMARTLHHLGSGRFAVADRLVVVPKETPSA
jgi:flavin reductase (DIM6/NTAB) family NADH-FMN oxidoreductase RutF